MRRDAASVSLGSLSWNAVGPEPWRLDRAGLGPDLESPRRLQAPAQRVHQVTDQATWAPLITAAFRTTTFVGPRIGNYTNLSFFGTALSQLWVR